MSDETNDAKAIAAKVVQEIDRTCLWGSDDYGMNHEFAAMYVADAILAERERCAKVAVDEYEAMKRLDMEHVKIHATKSAEICGAKARTAQSIAAAIRSPQPLKSVG